MGLLVRPELMEFLLCRYLQQPTAALVLGADLVALELLVRSLDRVAVMAVPVVQAVPVEMVILSEVPAEMGAQAAPVGSLLLVASAV